MAMSSQNQETQTLEIPEGFRFRPDDQELVRFYLYPKITNPNIFTTFNVPVRDCHLYGSQARDPWKIWDSFPKRHGEDLFFFTQLTKKGRHVVRQISGGPGKWHQDYKDPPLDVSIDPNCKVTAIRKVFTYHNPKSDHNGSWLLFEYSLPSLSQLTVLCQLRKKEVHNPETVNLQQSTTKKRKRVLQQSTTKKRKRVVDIESVDDARNTILQKPMIDGLDHQQELIMGFDGLVDIASQVENQQQHLQLEPLFDNGLDFSYFESFSCEDVQDFGIYLMATDSGSVSTSNVASPTVSTFNPAENSQSVEAVSVDGDAALALDHDFCLQLLDSSGSCDEADGFPATKATAQASAYWTQATPNLDESFTSDAVDYYLEHGVCDSSPANWSGSFSQMLLEEHTCLIQEKEIQMVSNPSLVERNS
uniref:NAC domain-containing protein n=1 Tax=Salix viminalis TaxID=40686 RepID=A0A6N2MVL3_SALVM